ncbi:uncharacterized protein LOC133321463 [Musca vetustissima]|uniref:uncharacterized protein LOC133321463 n=1 Tax=Musca vetustissima TaxID=27455 RepID=UPI002AB7654D|nr:uncharacterized protein LOC133321463 [Musca vetustissima]
MAADLSTTTNSKPTTAIPSSLTTTSSTENLYMHLNASELSAIIMKGSPHHSNDRDAGFCSGSSEGGDDFSMDNLRLAPNSPTLIADNSSDDSVEVKCSPISLVRNKRKSSEPSKVVSDVPEPERSPSASQSTGPLKKRIRYSSTTDSGVVLTPPAAPLPSPPATALWDPSQVLPHELMPNPAQVFVRHPGVTTLHRLPKEELSDELPQEQEEPLALVLKKSPETPNEDDEDIVMKNSLKNLTPKKRFAAKREHSEQSSPKLRCNESSSNANGGITLVPPPALSLTSSHEDSSSLNTSLNATSKNTSSSSCSSSKPQQRNYKNMTRERRIEANARERSRVHTISAAYETLRQAVPSYSNNQKLSKLSVLRVACSYILTLSRMAGYDYSSDQSEPSIADCFDAVTATIQTEGKIRKKKEDGEK